ncbi:MAG: RtcB family protein [Pseudomonadota bacterium]
MARLSTFYRAGTWIEGRAEDQLNDVAGWPGMFAVAGFPDLHPGRHGPVGAAFLADRLWPQLVGPDIGCGMALFHLSLSRRKLSLDKAARRFRALDAPWVARAPVPGGLSALGLGTIGGGNHFCEVQEVTESTDVLAKGALTLLVHSGSRTHGHGVFASLEGRWAEGFDPASEEGRAYLACHDACVAWARLNRACLADRAAHALRAEATLICDAPHNLVVARPDGWLHLKGAALPDRALAPLAGSREAPSYLLRATDAVPDALGALSHGAGRRYDRASMHGRVRKGRSDLAALARTRFGGRVICEDRALMVEEAGAAYKDVSHVRDDLVAAGLATSLATLAPLLTFKVTREGAR